MDKTQAVFVGGCVLLLAALAFLPDWAEAWEGYKQIMYWQIYGAR